MMHRKGMMQDWGRGRCPSLCLGVTLIVKFMPKNAPSRP
jgi:hypothetical protein